MSAPCRLRRNCRAEASPSSRKPPISTGSGAALNSPFRTAHAGRYISRTRKAFLPLFRRDALAGHPGERDLNGLVRNDVIPSLAPEPDRNLFPEGAKTPWIKPGRSTWTWWDRGNVRGKRPIRLCRYGLPNSAGDTTSLTKGGKNGAKPCRKAWTSWPNWPATPPAKM